MTDMKDIEQLTRKYKSERDLLAGRVDALQTEIERLKQRAMPGIKSAVARAREAEHALATAIEGAPQLFRKPRTVIFSGIKVGLAKGKGEIQYQDMAQVLKLIKKHLPDQADVLIAVKETPVKKSLPQLSAAELKKIGVTIRETGDQVVIRPTDSEVDKVVNALLKDTQKLEDSEAAA